jgi:DNA-binding LacI/PurR family transcriptional regulator
MGQDSLPSIVDVAQRAGVSIATASRVLSSSTYPVSETTRQKVLVAATELSYVPNSLARSLKAQRSKMVAVIVGDNADPYFAEVTRGVEEVANEHGYLTIVCNTDRNPNKEIFYLQTLQDYRVDGVLFAGGGLDEPGYTEQAETIVQQMQRRGAAVVALSQHSIHTPAIHVDNFRGAYDMTTHLIELGHRRIAFITGPSNLIAANMRLQGYMAALAAAGIALDPPLLLPGNFTQAGGEQAARRLVQATTENRPDAIFASNDETAFGVLSTLHRQGWRVPQDISLCGFGDLPMAQVMVPALTTVRIGLRDLGRRGAYKLFALLQKEEVPSLEIQAVTVVKRETTIESRGLTR